MHLEFYKDFKSHLPTGLSSMARVSALEHFGETIQPELVAKVQTGEDYDAVWKCDGGVFKVHKAVLAISSPYFKVSF